jgi:PST family polysaccharide transporter
MDRRFQPPSGNGATLRRRPHFDLFEDLQPSDLSEATRRGSALIILSKVVSIVVTLGSQAVLGRWLSPSDYGLFAMGLAALAFLLLFREFGLQAAGIQRARLTAQDASFLFWCNLGLLVVIAVIGAAAAPAVAAFYGQPDLTFVLLIMCAAAVAGGISAQHAMLLRRRMRFLHIAAAEITALACGSGAALIVGARYPDIRALLTLYFVQQAVLSVATIVLCGWRPSWPKAVLGAGAMLRFGAGVTLANLVYFITNNLATVLIGYQLKGLVLGNFNRAQQLYLMPSAAAASSLYLLLFGSLSRLSDHPQAYRAFYLLALSRISLLFFGLAGFLMVAGDDVVHLLLGPNWDLAGLLLRVMAFGLIGVGAAQMTGMLLQSQNRIRDLQLWSIADGLIRISAILLGSSFGVIGIAAGFAGATTLISSPLAMMYAGRKGPVSFTDQVLDLRGPAVICVAAAVGALIARSALADASPYLRIVCETAGAAISILTVGLGLPMTRHILRELASSVRRSVVG